jgi:hypothetical protein
MCVCVCVCVCMGTPMYVCTPILSVCLCVSTKAVCARDAGAVERVALQLPWRTLWRDKVTVAVTGLALTVGPPPLPAAAPPVRRARA